MQVNVLSYQIKEIFEKAKNVLIVLGDDADVDAAALAGSLVELFASYKKKATLLSRKALPEAAASLVKAENLRNSLEPSSLVVSLDWQKHKLDKVSYQVDGDKFNLIIASRGTKIEPNEISYSYRGAEFDLIVSVAIISPEKLYSFGIEPDFFKRLPSINFDKQVANTNFAKLNVVQTKADSVCSLAANVFQEAKIALPTKTAEIMLYGMRLITSNFTNVSEPATFEGAAYCKRSMIPGMVTAQEVEKGTVAKTEKNVDNDIPENWLPPKIYRSSRLS